MPTRKWLAIILCLAFCTGTPTSGVFGQNRYQALEVELPGGRFVGLPVHWSKREGILLESNGAFQHFSMQSVKSHHLLDFKFAPQVTNEFRLRLAAELGREFETDVTGPYVVAAPIGESARWKQRFSALYAGFTRYATHRGWPIQAPQFPLAVVVLPTRDAFVAYARREGQTVPDGAVGCYFPKSNRCVLFHIKGGRGVDWEETEATVAHEAIHQLAYNTGVHERLFNNPLWVVEGLASMFEVPQLYDLKVLGKNSRQRLHRYHFRKVQSLLASQEQLSKLTAELIYSDRLYRSQTNLAYALGWAQSFYLCERMPSQFRDYVELQRKRGFTPYSATQRMEDFQAAFGLNPEMLASRMKHFFDAF